MPKSSTMHVDQLLTNVAVQYKNNEYIADRFAPKVQVKKTTDLYRTYTRNFRLPETSQANGGKAREHDWEISTSSYVLERHALKYFVSDDDRDNYDLVDIMKDATEELTDKIMLRQEKLLADLFTTTSWSNNVSLAAANAWTANTTVSNPIPVMDTAQTTIIRNSGHKGNKAWISRDAYVAAKNHTSVLDRLKYTTAEVDPKKLAALFDCGELHIPLGVLDTSALGTTESLGNLFDAKAFVGYIAPNASMMKPSALYTFEKPQPVKRWRDEDRDSEGVKVTKQLNIKVVASLAGYLINGTD